ncbi:NAD-dependent epimerase/dehydratase family protein, partial [Vibrio parahaemolyticus]
TYPVDFLHDNLMISNSIIESAHETGVEKLVYLGSSCIYPRLATQPIEES